MAGKEGLTDVRTGNYREIIPSEGYEIVEWKPTQDGTGPATAVCLVMPFSMRDEDGSMTVSIMLRLKSRQAVDELISIMETHRNGVWPRD